MTNDIVIVGAGGFTRQCFQIIHEINLVSENTKINVIGVIDDFPSNEKLEALSLLGVEFLGSVDEFIHGSISNRSSFVIGIADSTVRSEIADKLVVAGNKPFTLLHPEVLPHPTTTIGLGCVVGKGVVLDPLVKIGNFVHINHNCTIGHDAELGDYVTLSPLVSIGGWTKLGAGSFVGSNATVLQNLEVGESSKVGAGACVINDVRERATVVGVPAVEK